MNKSRERCRASRRVTCTLVGGGLAAALAGSTWATVTQVDPGASVILDGDRNVLRGRGTLGQGNADPFNVNLNVRELKMGSKILSAERGDFRAPAVVVLLAKDDSGAFTEVPPAAVARDAKSKADFRMGLTPDLDTPEPIQPLDILSTPDLGRMMIEDGSRATRTQIFMTVPELDDNPLANDDSPELLLMGGVPREPVTITPILSGTPGDPDSLVFGEPFKVTASIMSNGLTGLSVTFAAAAAPSPIAVIGLDLSGDLGLKPGQTVVGYQLEVPEGVNVPLKMMPVGVPDDIFFGQYGGPDDAIGTVGDVLLTVDTPAPSPPLAVPELAPQTDYAANLLGFQESDQAFNTPPIPPLPPIPAPGSLALLVGAGLLSVRRRRS